MSIPRDPRTEGLERKYSFTSRLYDILDWPWELKYRKWRPDIVGSLRGRILEAGVGTGRNLPYYPPEADVHAIDLSQGMVERARKRAAEARCDVTIRRADALRLDHLDGASFDAYVSTFLYCVLPDELQPPGLAEMARVLKPGGQFRIVELLYSKQPLRRAVQKVLAPFVERVYGARFDRHTLEHLESLEAEGHVEITETRWLAGDTVLLIEGRRR